MGADGANSRHTWGAFQPLVLTTPMTITPLRCQPCEDQPFTELDAITRRKVWLHHDSEWSWRPWSGHWYHRVTIVIGRLCIDVCRCRCRECRLYVADLRARCDELEQADQ